MTPNDSSRRTRPGLRPLRILHTSDLHLGDSNSALARRALQSVIDTVLASQADALLIAGDLFDHSRVEEEEIAFFLGQVERCPQPVLVLPGNHDHYGDQSLYQRSAFKHAPRQMHLFTEPQGQRLLLPELGLEVWGRPTADHHAGFRPLLDVPPRQGNGWYIAMAHGHLQTDAKDTTPYSSPILPSDIASAACDYVALGHWPWFQDVSQNGVKACYCGSPHRSTGDLKDVLLVELEPGANPRVTLLPLSPRR